MTEKNTTTKIAIVGAGMVGSSFAYAAMLKKLAAEIIMIDVDEAREQGEVMDLRDALFGTDFGNVRRGDLRDCREADVVLITAGAAQRPGDTRLDLVDRNTKILRSIIKGMGKLRKDTIVVVVSNPVDVLTYIATKELRLPKGRVFGSGTALDTSRLRNYVGGILKVNVHNIHGYVLGEHGDSSFVPWSTVSVAGTPVNTLLTKKQQRIIEQKVRTSAYAIIQRKKATYYGIGVMATELVNAVMNDTKQIFPVSTEPGMSYGITGISLGVPAVLGRNGVEKVWPMSLTAQEKKKLHTSAALLKKVLHKAI